MHTKNELRAVLSLAEAAEKAVSEIARLLREEVGSDSPSKLVRVEMPVSGVKPLEWLRAQSALTQYYWSNRDSSFEMAGVGEAEVLFPSGPTDLAGLFEHVRAQLSPRFRNLRYYGGLRFHFGPVKGSRWKGFKEYRFVMPRFEVIRRNNRFYFACNARVGHARTNEQTLEHVHQTFARLRPPDTNACKLRPVMVSRTDAPNHSEWNQLVSKTVRAINAGELDKVVLARETCFTATETLDPVSLLIRLIDLSPHTFRFCFHPAEDRAFIGASPERLYRRVNVYLKSEAVAGTRPRGTTDENDHELGQALLNSAKDRREHQFVIDTLKDNFQQLCHNVEVEPQPSLLRLRNCQHLRTRIEGLLEDPHVDAELIETLHPTPGRGGVSPRPGFGLDCARRTVRSGHLCVTRRLDRL